jgi:hypothetical protein
MNSILSFIRSHDNLALTLPSGEIRVRTVYTQGQRYCLKTGRNRVVVGRVWETIPATMKAARELLGY